MGLFWAISSRIIAHLETLPLQWCELIAMQPHPHSTLPIASSPAVDNSTQRVKAKPKMPYVDYLAPQAKVSKGSFAFWLRQTNANPKTMDYLLSHIHQRIRNRPDVLESVLFDAEAQKLRDLRLIGFMVNEIKTRTVA